MKCDGMESRPEENRKYGGCFPRSHNTDKWCSSAIYQNFITVPMGSSQKCHKSSAWATHYSQLNRGKDLRKRFLSV